MAAAEAAAHLSAEVCEGLRVAQPQSFQIKQNLEKKKRRNKEGARDKAEGGLGGGRGVLLTSGVISSMKWMV